MFTLFTIPRPFIGRYAAEQHNALGSWVRLEPEPEIIVFGDEAGIRDASDQYDCTYRGNVLRNEFGTPTLPFIFEETQRVARYDVLAFLNTDIILMQDFADALEVVADQFESFLMVGRRRDLDIDWRLDFAAGWQDSLREWAMLDGKLYTSAGSDFICFRRWQYLTTPLFIVGRAYYDNWLIANALQQGADVIDATAAVCSVHQEVPTRKRSDWTEDLPFGDRELMHNRKEMERYYKGKAGWVTHAQWRMTDNGLIERT